MYVRRELEDDILKWLDEPEIIAIIGPRQSGKTTLLQHLREQLVEVGSFDHDHIVYITMDDEIERLRFEDTPKDFIEGKLVDEKPHLFLLDEIQYLENAGDRMKLLFDRNRGRIKFIITGSSSLDIRNISGALVGRMVLFNLYPFSFPEFLLARDKKLHDYQMKHRFTFSPDHTIEELAYLDELNVLLREYMTYGGFPRIVLMEDKEKKEFLLRQLVTLYIEKDILKLYGQPFRNDSLRILQYLAFHCGKLLDIQTVASHLGIAIHRVREVMGILESTFIIQQVRPYHKSLTTELRKRPKILFLDIGIRNVLSEDFAYSEEKGFLFENHVFTQLTRKTRSLKYWRTKAKAEVDYIMDGIPVEVKVTPKITQSLQSFLSTYEPPFAVIANMRTYDVKEKGRTRIFFVPVSLLP